MIKTRLVLGSLSVYTFRCVEHNVLATRTWSRCVFEDTEHSSWEERVARETYRTDARMVWPHDRASQLYVY